MKMAKASEADLQMAMELSNALESLAGRWGAYMPEKIEKLTGDAENERFEIDDHEHCRRVITYLIRLVRSASLMRVVWGAAVMLDPANKLVDPDADTIEHHPDRQTLEAVRQAVREYHAALDNRAHGGVAQDAAMHKIEAAIGMPWVQGASLKPAAAAEKGA